MRLVQGVMLSESGQTHLAEVFVSGLIKTTVLAGGDSTVAYYDFYDGVRDWLLDRVDNDDQARVLWEVSEFVEHRTGSSLDFRALLRDPTARGNFEITEECQYFARIGARVLRRLGGAYMDLANHLDPSLSGAALSHPKPEAESDAPTEPTPFRDRTAAGIDGPEMVWLPGGTFKMGDDNSEFDNEKPAHDIKLEHFAIGQYPVTFDEYDTFCSATNREKPKDEGWGRDRRPVINISWDDAQAYCQWLSAETGQQYGLLTEAQWEYASRAGAETDYFFGNDGEQLAEYAWYGENLSKGSTHPVGEKKT